MNPHRGTGGAAFNRTLREQYERGAVLRCEICGVCPRFRYPFRTMKGGGRGWVVIYRPGCARVADFDAATMKAWRIYTCGDAVCMWRARHHGVPGARYDAP